MPRKIPKHVSPSGLDWLTEPQRTALRDAASTDGLWMPKGSGQRRTAACLEEMGLGWYSARDGVFKINAAGREAAGAMVTLPKMATAAPPPDPVGEALATFGNATAAVARGEMRTEKAMDEERRARARLSSLPALRALLAYHDPADPPDVARAKAAALTCLAKVAR